MVGGKSALRLSAIVLVLGWVVLFAAFFVNAERRVNGPTGDFVHFL